MARTTINKVNAALKTAGHDAELVKGAGYFYFVGPDAPVYSSGVYVYHLNSFDVAQWVREFDALKDR